MITGLYEQYDPHVPPAPQGGGHHIRVPPALIPVCGSRTDAEFDIINADAGAAPIQDDENGCFMFNACHA
jgi:hypothetical protein